MDNKSNSRIKNTSRNIVSGIVNRLVSILLPFINRTALLWLLGAEFTGLNGLFSSILQVLNIAELGFHTAVVYSLYEPIAKKTRKKSTKSLPCSVPSIIMLDSSFSAWVQRSCRFSRG